MTTYKPNSPDKEQVVLSLPESNVTISSWTQYSFNSHRFQKSTPCDAFSFTLSDHRLSGASQQALRLGSRVRLTINSFVVADGYIDSIDVGASRSGGVVLQVSGRDRLGLAVDAVADPTKVFKGGQTLADVLKALFGPFGWGSDESFKIDNKDNRDQMTGSTSTGKSTESRPLKDIVIHQTKPHNHEGLYAFASRLVERYGVWIWCSADGEKLIVGRPNFYQKPKYNLYRANGRSNILSGNATYSIADQASVIVADGFSGGGEFGKGRVKSICINPFFGVDANGNALPLVADAIAKYPTASQVVMKTSPFPHRSTAQPLRVLYLHDDESKTQDQLDNFVRREMSLLMSKSLKCQYTVEGHGQLVDGEFVPWAPDTVVMVEDDVTGVHEKMWIQARTFTKSRSGGTLTELELIRLHSIQLGEYPEEPKKIKVASAGAPAPKAEPSKIADEDSQYFTRPWT